MSPVELGVCDCESSDSRVSLIANRTFTPNVSRSSLISAAPCIGRLTPLGKPRQDAKLIDIKSWQLARISLTASDETDDPHRFKWLQWIFGEFSFKMRIFYMASMRLKMRRLSEGFLLTLTVIVCLSRQWPWLHCPVALVHWPKPDLTRSDF